VLLRSPQRFATSAVSRVRGESETSQARFLQPKAARSRPRVHARRVWAGIESGGAKVRFAEAIRWETDRRRRAADDDWRKIAAFLTARERAGQLTFAFGTLGLKWKSSSV